jgi:hypothetical protein
LTGNEQDHVSDMLIQEVDEDLRRDQYLKLWKAYGKYAVAGAVAIVLGVAGHQAWLGYKDKRFQQSAARFQAADDLITAGKPAEAETRLAEIAGDKGGFAMLAGFRRAQMQVEAGDEAGAIASYDALSHGDAPQVFRDLAVLKGAMLALDKDDPEALSKRLQPIADKSNPWRFTATELLALVANRRGDKAQAVKLFKGLADDSEAPQAIRARAAEMLTVLGGAPEAGAAQKG